jgi:hypothetical protein
VIETAGELRAAFDRTFAEAPVAPVPHTEVLVFHAGGQPCAIARDALAALRVDLSIVTLPSPAPALLGVTSFHGELVPVWDLGLLAHGVPGRGRRWCAIVGGGSAAFAFDRLDGHLRVPLPIGRAIEHAGVAYPVLALDHLLAGRKGLTYGE